MEFLIDIETLRRDLMNKYGAEIFAGFDMALEDLLEVDDASAEEVIAKAKKAGIDLNQYKINN